MTVSPTGPLALNDDIHSNHHDYGKQLYLISKLDALGHEKDFYRSKYVNV
jgi:hypothetical protein